MQYGNEFDVNANGLRLTSLNRTMQYGNRDGMKRKFIMVKGLNRTMQYGNFLPVSSKIY